MNHETTQELEAREQADVALGRHLAGKYMTFKLANEEYGLEILKVREIIGMMDITRVPQTKAFVRGVINLRGRVIPVVDLRCKFDLEQIEVTDQTVIIVVQLNTSTGDMTMGILVDEVLEVLDIKADAIEPPPQFGTGAINVDFVLGIGKAGKRLVFLMNIDKVLSFREVKELGAATQRPEAN